MMQLASQHEVHAEGLKQGWIHFSKDRVHRLHGKRNQTDETTICRKSSLNGLRTNWYMNQTSWRWPHHEREGYPMPTAWTSSGRYRRDAKASIW